MNTTLDTTFETNFNTVMKMSEAKYDYNSLIAFLKSENLAEKQIAVLKLEEVKSKADTQLLVSNLVGQDGKIREAVAFKINEFIKVPEYRELFLQENIFDNLLKGIMDINGNVCRLVLDSASVLSEIDVFSSYFCSRLPEKIENILCEIKNIPQDDKKYVFNKKNFQLYWALEAMFLFVEKMDFSRVKKILFACADFEDYTIREKVAKILFKFNHIELEPLAEKLKSDNNYYVRRCFGVKI